MQKRYADEGRSQAPNYKAGDLVLLKTRGLNGTSKDTHKFIPRREGPYRIQGVVGAPTPTYSLERICDGTLLGKYHVSMLTPFLGHTQASVQGKRRRGRPRKANSIAESPSSG